MGDGVPRAPALAREMRLIMKTWLALAGALLVGCASSPSADSTVSCEDGSTRPCTCDAGASGTQTCAASTWNACHCGMLDAPIDQKSDAPAVCGDQRCENDKNEDCVSCPTDCGQCKPCDYAPGCSGAASVPLSFEPLDDFDNDGQPSYSS